MIIDVEGTAAFDPASTPASSAASATAMSKIFDSILVKVRRQKTGKAMCVPAALTVDAYQHWTEETADAAEK